MKFKLNNISRCFAVLSLGTAISYPALAQQQGQQETQPQTQQALEQQGLEHITVTSTKRSQSINDIPMSIQAIDGEALTAESIEDLGELSGAIPNLIISETLGTTNVNIRGMGTGTDRSFEQSVSMFIDGIYMPRSRQYRSPFLDTERVEVLRGTQAVLFGLNSTAGAISVVSKKSRPEDDFYAQVSVDHETEAAETVLVGVVGGGVSDTLGLRLAVQNVESDGFGENTFTGEDTGGKEQTLIRLSGVWEPTADLTVTAKVENAEYDVDGNLHNTFTENGDYDFDISMDGGNLPLFVRNEYSDFDHPRSTAGMEQESTNVAIDISYDINDYTLSAIIGYSDFEFTHALDLDSTSDWILGPLLGAPVIPATPTLDNILHENYEQTSFELRLASPVSDTFSYIIGLYYQESELENVNPNITNTEFVYPALAALPFTHEWAEASFDQDTEAYSVFANATWAFSDDWRAIFGARYISEDKEHSRKTTNLVRDPEGNWLPVPGLIIFTGTFDGLTGDRTSENFMPEAMLQWDANDDTMVYAKVGTSAKSGGFASSVQLRDENQFEYDDEEALGYEAGVKMTFAEGSADVNLAIFRTEYDDLQVNTFDENGLPAIQNAASSISQGLELESRWMVNDWLLVGASVAYLDAEYDDFERGSCNGQELAAGLSNPCDKSGETMPFAPEVSGKVFADVIYPAFSGVDLTFGVSVQYSDEFYTEGTLDERGLQESFTKVNARIGLKSSDDIWDLSVIGKNLGDEITLGSYQSFLGQNVATFKAPMTVNLQATYRFGG
ncbi:TonB-dependent receptor [Thalassotalea sp. HSM 43]|uniref:TonB-dependent receptor n=1 Tax=Thalassotalea sp. HSM 43 TaxID=2552945 RepID=UPI00107FE088|nr:TonB-dependent receptor [Thalassotalea sp. HSM 43]QBY03299.1 TonB-dependent receptor [Thalassotalea sp. HSM 43]